MSIENRAIPFPKRKIRFFVGKMLLGRGGGLGNIFVFLFFLRPLFAKSGPGLYQKNFGKWARLGVE